MADERNPGDAWTPARFGSDEEAAPASPPAPQPVLRSFRHARHARTAPGRRLRLLVVLAATGTLAALGIVAVSVFLGDGDGGSPWDAADRFVTCLKLGEEREAGSADERMGYALAYDQFTDSLKQEVPWIDFLQRWVRLSREHGYVMSSLRRSQRQHRRGDRHKRVFVYDLFLGGPDQRHEDMPRFRLRLQLARVDGVYGIRAYELVPVGPHQR